MAQSADTGVMQVVIDARLDWRNDYVVVVKPSDLRERGAGHNRG